MRIAPAAVLLVMTVSPAFAQREPQIVIPGRPDVPVIINGVDARWGVVEGEFGLDRPGLVAPTVIYRPLLLPAAAPEEVPGYFPRLGRRPGYGRLEIVPPSDAPKPRPAPTYYRRWSSQSGSAPATIYQEYSMPPVVVEPRHGRYGNRNRNATARGHRPH